MTQQLPAGFVVGEQPKQDAPSGLPAGFVVGAQPEAQQQPQTEGRLPANVQAAIDRAKEQDWSGVEIEAPRATWRLEQWAESMGDWLTGKERQTEQLEGRSGLSGVLADTDTSKAKALGLGALTAFTNDPEELADIMAAQVPELRKIYERDAQGNLVPQLFNTKTGQVHVVDPIGVDPMNVGRTATQTAAFATPVGGGPVGAIAGTVAKDAAIQGIVEASQAGSGGQFDAGEVALAGALGGGGEALGRVGGAAIRAIGGRQSDEAAELLAAGQEYDVPVMTSDVVPPTTSEGRIAQNMAQQIPLVGTAGRRLAQQEAREQAVNRFAEQYGGGSYEAIIESLQNSRNAAKQRAGRVYQDLTPKIMEAGESSLNRTLDSLAEAEQSLIREGRKASESTMDLFQEMQDTFLGGGQTYDNLKSNISYYQQMLENVDVAGRSQFPSNDKRILEQVLRAARQDRDDLAREALTEAEFTALKGADREWGEMATDFQRTRLKQLLDKGDVTPENARNILMSQKPSEIKTLYDNLTPSGRTNARALIVDDILDTLSKRAGDGLSPDAFSTELRKRGKSLNQFFQGAERQQLNGFMRLLDHTARAGKVSGAVDLPTGVQTIPWLLTGGVALSGEPITTAAGVGGLALGAQLYESPMIRPIIARMANVSPNTAEFENLYKQLTNAARTVAQTQRDQQELQDAADTAQ